MYVDLQCAMRISGSFRQPLTRACGPSGTQYGQGVTHLTFGAQQFYSFSRFDMSNRVIPSLVVFAQVIERSRRRHIGWRHDNVAPWREYPDSLREESPQLRPPCLSLTGVTCLHDETPLSVAFSWRELPLYVLMSYTSFIDTRLPLVVLMALDSRRRDRRADRSLVTPYVAKVDAASEHGIDVGRWS